MQNIQEPVVETATGPETAVAAALARPGAAVLERAHLAYLDGMRAIAALLIVLHHALLQSWPVTLYPDAVPSRLLPAWAGWQFYSNFGVIFFIALSGFCLMIPVVRRGGLRGGAREFLAKRLRRIAPPYYAALALSVVIAGWLLRPHTHTLYDNSLPVTARGVLLHLLFLHNLDVHTKYQINGPLWSIGIEVQIYLLFPLFVWLWTRRGIVPVLTLGLVLTTVFHYALRGTVLAGFSATYISIFTMGMYASLLVFNDGSDRRSRRRAAALRFLSWVPAIALLPLLFPAQAAGLMRNHMTAMDLVGGLISSSFLVILGRNPLHPVRRLVSWLPLVWVGGFSYSLYLIHFPLQQLFWQTFLMNSPLSHGVRFAIVATVGTVLIVLSSWGFYRLCEKPFARSRPRAGATTFGQSSGEIVTVAQPIE